MNTIYNEFKNKPARCGEQQTKVGVCLCVFDFITLCCLCQLSIHPCCLCQQVILILESSKERAIEILNAWRNCTCTVEALQNDGLMAPGTAFPKGIILSGNHSISAMVRCAKELAADMNKEDPGCDVKQKAGVKWNLFTNVNCTVYYGLEKQTARVVRVLVLLAVTFQPTYFCCSPPFLLVLCRLPGRRTSRPTEKPTWWTVL